MIRERAKTNEPVLVLEAGDAFAMRIEPQVSPEGVRARAELMVAAYNQAALDAYTPGERDLALGLDGLKAMAEQAKFPFLAANLVDGEGKTLFQGSLLKKVGKLSIGVIGLIGQKTGAPATLLEQAKLSITDPVAAARTEADKLKQQGAELLLVLSHLGPGEDSAVARALPEVRFVLGDHGARMTRQAQAITAPAPAGGGAAIPSTWVFSPGSRGKYLGRLELYPGQGADALSFADGGERDQLASEISNHERSVERTRKRLEEMGGKPLTPRDDEKRRASRLEAMQRSIERSEKQIAEKQQRLTGLKRPGKGRAIFRNTLMPVEVKIAGDPEIDKKVQALNASGVLKPLPRLAPPAGGAVPARPGLPSVRGLPVKMNRPKALAPRLAPGPIKAVPKKTAP